MTWTKLSDDFADDCWQLTDQAVRLHIDGLIWSNRKLLDLRIPKDDLARASRASDSVSELVSKSFWSDEGDHYLIRHHGIYQRSRDQVINQQAANRSNGKRGGRPRGPAREIAMRAQSDWLNESVSQSLNDSKTERDRTGQDSVTEPQRNEQLRCRNCRPPTNLTPDNRCDVHRTTDRISV